MNLYKLYVKEKGLKKEYRKWLESRLSDPKVGLSIGADTVVSPFHQKNGALYDEPEVGENSKVDTSFIDENGITIDYSNPKLDYQVEVVFHRLLTLDEKSQVEQIIDYWSKIPFVSVEGNYGIEWGKTRWNSLAVSKVIIDIDFTKSASDDIGARQVLEQLGEWIWQGTPIRKRTNDRKYEGTIRPVSVTAGSM